MVTSNQKSVTDTHTQRKESKHNTKNSHQTTKEQKKKKQKRTAKTIKMAIRTYISIITLNVNSLNAPIKRHRVAEWIQKQDSYICCLQKTHFRSKDTHRLNVKGWKKVFHTNGNQKKAKVAILISEKIHFKTKTVTGNKEVHYIMIKGSIQENIEIVNIYTPIVGPPKYRKKILTD